MDGSSLRGYNTRLVIHIGGLHDNNPHMRSGLSSSGLDQQATMDPRVRNDWTIIPFLVSLHSIITNILYWKLDRMSSLPTILQVLRSVVSQGDNSTIYYDY